MTQSFEEQLSGSFTALAEQLRATVAEHVSAAVETLAAEAASRSRAAADLAASEAAAAAERDVTTRLTEAFTHREAQLRELAHQDGLAAGLEQARAEALVTQQARDAEAERAAADADERLRAVHSRLLLAMRELDASTSLSQTLDVLASAAELGADRVAIFVLRGETLRAWSHFGFDAMDSSDDAEVPLASAGIVADAIRTAEPQRISATDGRPAFAGDFTSGAFVAVPLTMHAQVIAVLCGEQLSATDEGERLATTYEVLARHGARVLETLTARRLAKVGRS